VKDAKACAMANQNSGPYQRFYQRSRMKKALIANRAIYSERIKRLPTSKDPIAILLPTQAAKGWSPEIPVWTSLSICSTGPVGSSTTSTRLSDHPKQRHQHQKY
jgi:hypothetical protein